MVGAVALVFLGASAEFGIGHHQGVVPAPDFNQCVLEHHQAFSELLHQVGVGSRLVLMGIESTQAHANRRDTRRIRRNLRGGTDLVAERPLRKHRAKFAAHIQAGCRLDDVGLDLEDVVQRRILREPTFFVFDQFRLALELVRVGQRHAARRPRQWPHFVAAQHHAVGKIRARHRVGGEGARQPALVEEFTGVRAGVPDLDRTKMRQVGIRIADAFDDGHLLSLPQGQQRREGRMQAGALRQLHHLVAFDADTRPQCRICRVGKRHHGIEAVIRALEFDQDQQVAEALALLRPGRAPGQHRQCRADAQEVASFHRCLTSTGTSGRAAAP